MGVWSVVLATSSLATLVNAGITTSVVRFAAIYKEAGGIEKLRKLAFTALVMMVVLFSFISIIVYPFASIILNKIIPVKYIAEALNILPYSILWVLFYLK